MSRRQRTEQTSLDVLVSADLSLQDQFAEVEQARGPSVEQRYRYGELGKEVLSLLAVRQAYVTDVAGAVSAIPELQQVGTGLLECAMACRAEIDELVDMSVGVQGMYLNLGQDFDGPSKAFIDEASSTIRWELEDAIPKIVEALADNGAELDFHSGRLVRHHASRRLNPSGARWHERAPIISRIVTIWHRLKDIRIWPCASRPGSTLCCSTGTNRAQSHDSTDIAPLRVHQEVRLSKPNRKDVSP